MARAMVVWHEAARSQGFLYQRMAPTDDLDAGLNAKDRTHPAMPSRDGGQRGDRVEVAEPCRGVEQVAACRGDPPAQSGEELVLARHHRALRVEDQRLFFFELRCDVPLAIDQRLLAHILWRDRLPVGVAHFEVIAEHLVESDFQRPDPGPLSFGLLEAADPVAGRTRARPNAIEFGVETGPKNPAILERGGETVPQGMRPGAGHLRARRRGAGGGRR